MQLNKAMPPDKAIQPDKAAMVENGLPIVKDIVTPTKWS